MASRIMHLAIAKHLQNNLHLDDYNRFCFGCLLPDACPKFTQAHISHFKIQLPHSKKVTYDLNAFQTSYAKEIWTDPLYLGYYMHLVQDLFFRQFVYEKHSWDPRPDGNILRLHNDYRLLNTYIIENYKIENTLSVPQNIEQENIFRIYPFDTASMLAELQTDFIPFREGSAFFFTAAMADEYLDSTAEKCLQVFQNLQNGKSGLDAKKYAWEIR